MTTSRTHPSIDLVSRYLQAVGFWLPRAQKQDILAELSEADLSGGNLSGIAMLTSSFAAKRLQLLHDLVPMVGLGFEM